MGGAVVVAVAGLVEVGGAVVVAVAGLVEVGGAVVVAVAGLVEVGGAVVVAVAGLVEVGSAASGVASMSMLSGQLVRLVLRAAVRRYQPRGRSGI